MGVKFKNIRQLEVKIELCVVSVAEIPRYLNVFIYFMFKCRLTPLQHERRRLHRLRRVQARTTANRKEILFFCLFYFGPQTRTHMCTLLHASTEKRKHHSCAPVLHIIIAGQSQHTVNFQAIAFLFPAKSNTTVLMWVLTGFYPLFPLVGAFPV